jgi:hypothetical protein
MDSSKLRQKLCTQLPDDLQLIIWRTYHSKYVLEEMLQVTKGPCMEYEELYEDCREIINTLIESATEISTRNIVVWNITLTNIEFNISVDDFETEDWNFNEDMYNVFQKVKQWVSYPSFLRIELSKMYNRSCDDLRLMIEMCETLQRMILSNT